MRRARNGRTPYKVFLAPQETDPLSVDRLDHASDTQMAGLGETDAEARSRSFHGWAVVTVEHASRRGRAVEPRPLIDNPYHAEIYLNLSGALDRADQAKEHAYDLALHALFRPRP